MSLIKIIFLLCLAYIFVGAREIKPHYIFKASGFVNDFSIDGTKLYIAGDAGVIDIYNIETKKLLNQIILEPQTTGQGVLVSPVISSVDAKNENVIFTSTTMSGYKNVWLYKDHKLTLIIDESKKLTVKEARFVDDETVMLSTLGADVILHNIGESYSLYRKHIADSTIGDYQLSHDKKTMAIADESGAVTIVNVHNSKIIKQPNPQNVDNIFHIAYASDTVITAGQDRRVGVYPNFAKPYYIKQNFLVYCVGLNPSASVGVYTKGEENVLQLFNPQTKQNIHTLVGHKGVVNQIKFTDENKFYSSDRSRYVYFWIF